MELFRNSGTPVYDIMKHLRPKSVFPRDFMTGFIFRHPLQLKQIRKIYAEM
jgi:hypothetical protein